MKNMPLDIDTGMIFYSSSFPATLASVLESIHSSQENSSGVNIVGKDSPPAQQRKISQTFVDTEKKKYFSTEALSNAPLKDIPYNNATLLEVRFQKQSVFLWDHGAFAIYLISEFYFFANSLSQIQLRKSTLKLLIKMRNKIFLYVTTSHEVSKPKLNAVFIVISFCY